MTGIEWPVLLLLVAIAAGLRNDHVPTASTSKNRSGALMQLSDNGFPRRNRIDLYTPAESAIAEAIAVVESLGCHTLLTEAVCLLSRAKEAVADFVELPQT